VPGLAEDATALPSKSAVVNKNAPPASGPKKPAIIEKEPVIPGIVISRTNGGYLGLTLENSNFKLSFYDAKKNPAKIDVARATARWPVHYKTTEERTVLNPTPDNLALIANKFVRPPYVFKLYLTLLKGEEGTAEDGAAASAESYTIDFQQ
jgi:hypothetical protein